GASAGRLASSCLAQSALVVHLWWTDRRITCGPSKTTASGGAAMGDMTMEDVLHPNAHVPDAAFPNAPRGWTQEQARQIARAEGVEPAEDHWEAVRALQNLYARRT